MTNDQIIFLCGFMGAGKSRLGRRLAELKKLPFRDLDAEIVQGEKRNVNQIFEERGEAYFRKLESVYLSQLIQLGPAVIALGGGTLQNPENLQTVKSNGLLVFINPSIETLADRLAHKTGRPLLLNDDGSTREKCELETYIRQLFKKRLPVYMQAELVFEPDHAGVEENADKLLSIINQEK